MTLRVAMWLGIGFVVGVIILLGLFGFAKWVGFTTSDFLALLQVVAALSMVPITATGFIILVHEFRKSEAKPKIDLFFEGYVKETELLKPKDLGGDRLSWPKLILLNSGNTIARWYSVEMQFPSEIAPAEQAIQQFLSDSVLGDRSPAQSDTRRGNWFYRWAWRPNEPPLFCTLSFRSDGTYAIYINHPLELIVLNIPMKGNKEYAERYEVPYLIASDWGDPVKGKLVFRVVNQE